MENTKILKFTSVILFVISIGYFSNILYVSKATSYLSSDSRACINCHVMNSEYSSWQHSSHANINCISCHLPNESTLSKYLAKIEDGFHHSKAFTLNEYKEVITISKEGAKRVQKNCISCHSSLTSEIVNNENVHSFKQNESEGRYCWDCHRGIPHGTVKGLTSTPNSLGVKENK